MTVACSNDNDPATTAATVTGNSARRRARRSRSAARAGDSPACHANHLAAVWTPSPRAPEPSPSRSAATSTNTPWAAFNTPAASAVRPSKARTRASNALISGGVHEPGGGVVAGRRAAGPCPGICVVSHEHQFHCSSVLGVLQQLSRSFLPKPEPISIRSPLLTHTPPEGRTSASRRPVLLSPSTRSGSLRQENRTAVGSVRRVTRPWVTRATEPPGRAEPRSVGPVGAWSSRSWPKRRRPPSGPEHRSVGARWVPGTSSPGTYSRRVLNEGGASCRHGARSDPWGGGRVQASSPPRWSRWRLPPPSPNPARPRPTVRAPPAPVRRPSPSPQRDRRPPHRPRPSRSPAPIRPPSVPSPSPVRSRGRLPVPPPPCPVVGAWSSTPAPT